MPDIRIVPGNAIMSFTSSLNFIEKLTQDPSGSLTLFGSGSVGRTDLFSIDGNNGRLFSVSDDLSDSLFSVNTIAGLPVIEAFADNTVKIGKYGAEAIVISGSNNSLQLSGSIKAVSLGTSADTNIVVFNTTSKALAYNTALSLTGATGPIGVTGATGPSTAINATNDTTTTLLYPVTVAAAGSNQTPKVRTTATAFSFNASSNTLSATTFAGSTLTLGSHSIYNYITSLVIQASTGTTIQLGGGPGNIQNNVNVVNGTLAAGTTSPQGKFHVYQSTNLGGTAGNNLILQTLQNTGGSGGNNVYIKDYALRDATGTTWTTWRHHNSIDIDGSHNTPGTNTKAFYERDPLSGLHEFGQEGTYAVTIDGVNSRLGVATRTPIREIQVGDFTGNREICIGTSTTGFGSVVFGDGASGNDPWRGYLSYNHSGDYMVIGTTNGERVRVTSAGAMGLGVTPTNTSGRFEASNDIVAYSSSDKRWKTGIKSIDSPLEKISQINGVEFDWIEDEPVHGNKGHDIGVIAQEIELILPEAVKTRESGMKAVKYEKVIPLLIEAIKEQQKQIEELKQIVNGITG